MLRLLAAFCAGLLIPAAIMAGSGDFPSDLEQGIAIDPPEDGSDGWFVANGDVEHEWVITLRDGRPRVHLRDREAEAPAPLPFPIEPGSAREGLAGERFSIQVSDGWIIGFNAGEFGAGLWWFSPDGRERSKISETWISGLIPTEAGLMAPAALAHGGVSEGRIIRLARGSGGRWQSEDFVDLKHAPEAAVKDVDGSLIVATTARLLRVLPASRKVEVLLENAFWGGLDPNSIVIAPSGSIDLGMRHGVAKVQKRDGSYTLRWLLPNNEFAEMKPREGFKEPDPGPVAGVAKPGSSQAR